VTVPLSFEGVSVVRDSNTLLSDLDWSVGPGERWVVLGPNGSGKTTLIRVASLYVHPSSGSVTVLDHELGRVDVRPLRSRVGIASSTMADMLRPQLTATEAVMCVINGALEPWWHTYTEHDRARARDFLAQVGAGAMADRALSTLSSGERQRVQLARTLMAEPDLLLLDEPTAGLDLGGREDLIGRLGALAASNGTAPTVLVTHHVDEIPASFDHMLLLRDGQALAAGPIEELLTAENLSECFGLELTLNKVENRWIALAKTKSRGV